MVSQRMPDPGYGMDIFEMKMAWYLRYEFDIYQIVKDAILVSAAI